jgi:hypothetical protein
MTEGLRRFCCTLIVFGCTTSAPILSGGPQGSGQTGELRLGTLRVLDRAIALLSHPDADHKTILGNALAALPPTGNRARRQIQAFLARVPRPGLDFRCSEEVIRIRARDLLWRARDLELDVQTRPIEPLVCYAAPFAVDAERSAAVGQPLEIYGYDFDTVPLQLVLIAPDGFRDVTSNLRVISHTHLTVTVGGGGVSSAANADSIGVAWGHIIHFRVPLVTRATRLCRTYIETMAAGKAISYSPVAGADGQSRRSITDADVRLDYSSNVLEAALCVIADDASVSGCFREFLHSADADRVIDGVVGPQQSQLSVSRNDPRTLFSSRHGLVSQWVLDRNASVVARLRQMVVVSRDAEGCLSPVAYVEARRTTAFPAATARALQAQLRQMDSRVATLRPRFAPP